MNRPSRRKKATSGDIEPERGEEDASERIHDLRSRSGRGLWPLVLFASVSLWAQTGFKYFPRAPDEWRDFLGRPPPPAWISAAFVLYIFSAMVLNLTKMAGEGAPGAGFRHVGYLAAFYGFYYVSGTLEDSFWAVLVGGLAVLTLECYRNWLYYRQQIREELDRLGRIDRR